MKTKISIASALAAAGFLLIGPGAAMADAAQAEATAAVHAGLAATQSDIKAVHTHMHHALNCLVGPDGDGFDKDEFNPCAQTGAAIPQTTDAKMKDELKDLAMQLEKGIKSDDLATAKQIAMKTQEMLKK